MAQSSVNLAGMRPLRQGDLQVGKPLACAIYDRHGILLLQRGGVVENENQLETLLERDCLIASACAAGVGDPLWLEAVLHHHERLDGSGYPHGLRGDDIPHLARLLGIVDIYTAMLRPRTYRDAVPARMALRNIFLERGKQVDEALATLLIKELGVYPPGTLVRLANDEIGVVLHRGGDAAHPQVSRLMTAEGYRASVAVVRDTHAAEFQIVDSVPHGRYPGLLPNIAALWN